MQTGGSSIIQGVLSVPEAAVKVGRKAWMGKSPDRTFSTKCLEIFAAPGGIVLLLLTCQILIQQTHLKYLR